MRIASFIYTEWVSTFSFISLQSLCIHDPLKQITGSKLSQLKFLVNSSNNNILHVPRLRLELNNIVY